MRKGIKREQEIAQDAIGWIQKNRIGKSQWVKSSGVANATRTYVRGGLPESDAEVRVERLMADRGRWGCALRDEREANQVWQSQVDDFLRSKAKGTKYTSKQYAVMLGFLESLTIKDTEKKLDRYLMKSGYELKKGFF